MSQHVSEFIPKVVSESIEPAPPANPKLGQDGKPVINSPERCAKFFSFNRRLGTADETQMTQMVVEATRFIRAMQEKCAPYWLSLIGSSGTGKTHLARRIYRWHQECSLVRDGMNAEGSEIIYAREWCRWPELAALLQANDGFGQLHDIRVAKFAVLDEVGGEFDKTGHATNCLSRILCGRVGKWTVITSNLTMDDVEKLDARIASRMIRDGSVVVDVNAEDYALWKKKNP